MAKKNIPSPQEYFNEKKDIPSPEEYFAVKKKDGAKEFPSPEVESASTPPSNELIRQAEIEGPQRPPLSIQEQFELDKKPTQKEPQPPKTEIDQPIQEMMEWGESTKVERDKAIEQREIEFAKESVNKINDLSKELKLKKKEAYDELSFNRASLARNLSDSRGLSELVKENPSYQSDLDYISSESKDLYAAVKQSEENAIAINTAEEILIKAKKYYDTKDSGVIDSLFNSQYGKDFLSFGFNEMFRNINVLQIADMPESERSEEETMALTAYALNDQMMSTNPQGVQSIMGSGIASTIPFLIEFYVSGGTSSAAKVGTKKFLKELSEKQTNKLVQAAIKKLIPTAAAAAGAAATTPFLISELLPTVPNRMIGNLYANEVDGKVEIERENQESFEEAFTKTLATTYATAAIEGFGEGITKITQKGKKVFLTTTAPGKKIARITEGITKRIPKIPGVNNAAANIGKKVFNDMGIQSTIAEVSEEIIEAYAHPAITGDRKMSEVWDNTQMLGILGTVMVIGGARKGIDIGFRGAYDERIVSKRNLSKSAKKLQPQTVVDIDNISKGNDLSTNSAQLDDYIKKKNIEGATGDDIRNILNYYANSIYVKNMDESQAEAEQPLTKKEEKEIETAKLDLSNEDVELNVANKPNEALKATKIEQVEQTPTEAPKVAEKTPKQQISSPNEPTATPNKSILQEDVNVSVDINKKTLEVLKGERDSLIETLKEVPEDQKVKIETEISDVNKEIVKQESIVDNVVQDGKKIQVEIDRISKIKNLDKKRSVALQSASDRIARLGNLSFAMDEKGKRQAIEDMAGLAIDLANAGVISLEMGAVQTAKLVRDYLESKDTKAGKFIDENRADIEAAIEAQSNALSRKTESKLTPPPVTPETEIAVEDFNEFPVGVTNSYTQASRIARGKDPIAKEASRSNPELWSKVNKSIESGEIDPRVEVKRIYQDDNPSISDEKQAMVLHDRIRITNERILVQNELSKAQGKLDTETEANLYLRMAQIEVEQQINDVANSKLGATWGRSGQFRQRLASQDYSLESIIREAKILNSGIPLTTAQERSFAVLSEMYKRLQQENALLQNKIEEEKTKIEGVSEEQRKEIEVEVIKKLQAKARKEGKDAQSRAGDIKARGKKIANKIRSAKLKNQPFTFSTVVPPQIIDGAMEVIAKSIELATSAPKAALDIISAINDGINYIKNTDWYKKLNDKDKINFKNKFKEYAENQILIEDEDVNSAEFDSLIEKLIEKADGEFHEGLSGILNKIAYNRVKAGKTEINDAVSDVYEAIKDEIPDVTDRDIRDGMSGYGKFRKLSKEEVDIKVRELKRQGRLDSSLEDVGENKLPLRSGVERDIKTETTRRKEAELAKNIKDKNLVPEPTQEEQDDQWRSAQDAYHRRLENAIEDIEKEISSGEKRSRAKGKTFDDAKSIKLRNELESLKKLRDEAFNLPPKTPEQKRKDAVIRSTQKAIAELTKQIDDAVKGVVPEGTNVVASRRGGRDNFSYKKQGLEPLVDEEIDNLKNLKESLQRELSDIMPESIKDKALLEKYKKQREKSLDRLLKMQETKDYGPKLKPTIPPFDKETKDLNRKIHKVKEAVEKEKEVIRLAQRTNTDKAKDIALDVWNLTKALTASVDLSAPFRQGLIMIGKPKVFARAFTDMFRHAFSKAYHENWLLDLKDTDVYYEMKDNRLFIAEPTSKLSAKEEVYMSNLLKYVDWIPIAGDLRAGSERAYVGFLNKLRTDAYLDFRDKLKKEGFAGEELQKELKGYARWINVSTGRGNLGPLESIAPILNGAYFSPRLISARLATVNPWFWAGLPIEARREALKTMGNFLAISMTMLISYDLLHEDDDDKGVEWDPRSTDFLKMKDGNVRYDIMGGIQPILRSGAQFITGQVKTTTTGDLRKLRKEEFPGKTRADVAKSFFGNKLAPTTALFWGMANDFTDPIGNPMTFNNTFWEKILPMYLSDVVAIAREEGIAQTAVAATTALFGVGVQMYGTDRQDAQREIEKIERDIKRAEVDLRQSQRMVDKTGERKYKELRNEASDKIESKKEELKEAERVKNRIQ